MVPTALAVYPLGLLVREAPAEAAKCKKVLSMNSSKSWMVCMCAPTWHHLEYSQYSDIREDDEYGRDVETL